MSSVEFETPFLLGLIDLEDGMGRLAAKIVDARTEDLEIDMPICLHYVRPDGEFTLYCIGLEDQRPEDP